MPAPGGGGGGGEKEVDAKNCFKVCGHCGQDCRSFEVLLRIVKKYFVVFLSKINKNA